MNIPELTSASSIGSGQGKIREQTSWEAQEGDGGWRHRENEGRRRRRAARSRNSAFRRSSVRSTCKSPPKDQTSYYMLNVRAASLTGCSLVWLNNYSPGWNCSCWHQNVVFMSHYRCTCEELHTTDKFLMISSLWLTLYTSSSHHEINHNKGTELKQRKIGRKVNGVWSGILYFNSECYPNLTLL